MTSLLDTIRSEIGPAEIANISQRLGVDPAVAQQAIDSALPLVVSGMAQHAASPAGAQQIADATAQHGGILSTIANAIGAATQSGGGDILGGILGRHADSVDAGVQQTSGLDSARTRQLLLMLAPIVLGFLARHHQQQTGGAPGETAPASGGGLASILRREAASAAQSASPELGNILGKIFGG